MLKLFGESAQKHEQVLQHSLMGLVSVGANYKKLNSLKSSHEFKSSVQGLEKLFSSYEVGYYASDTQPLAKPFLRLVLWSQEATKLQGLLNTLRNRNLLNQADVYLLPNIDLGLQRTGNKNLARELALELGLNYVFVPTYLHMGAENSTALEGHAILTRWPIHSAFWIPIAAHKLEPHEWKYFRLGRDGFLNLKIQTEQGLFNVGCGALPKHSTHLGRWRAFRRGYHQLKTLSVPWILGANLWSTTIDTSHRLNAFLSVANKLWRDIDFMAREHFIRPQIFFERFLFKYFERKKIPYATFNALDTPTYFASLREILGLRLETRWLKLLYRFGHFSNETKHGFKTDWFLGQKVRPSDSHLAERPKVISHIVASGERVSAHDPVLIDVAIEATHSLT